jgi:hypothetical protein
MSPVPRSRVSFCERTTTQVLRARQDRDSLSQEAP